MNQRILELAIQAGWSAFEALDERNQKFAQLIVRECERVSLKNSHRDDDMGAIIARQILKHFGVEE